MSQRDQLAPQGAVAFPWSADQPAPRVSCSPEDAAPDPSCDTRFSDSPHSDEPASPASQPHVPASPLVKYSSSSPPGVIDFPSVLERVFQTPIDLPPASFVELIEPFDSELNGPQRDAVARAVQAEDLLLIQGLPGTGKSRIIVEIIRQAIVRGKRVLFLASTGSAVDVVLSRFESTSELIFVRCLGNGERSDQFDGAVAAGAARVREKNLHSELTREVQRKTQEAEQKLAAFSNHISIWASFLELADRQQLRNLERDRLCSRRQTVRSEICGESESSISESTNDLFRTAIQQNKVNFENRLAQLNAVQDEIRQQIMQAEKQRAAADALRDALRPQENALRRGRFWSPSYWKAKFNKSIWECISNAQDRIDACEKNLQVLKEDDNRLEKDRGKIAADWAAERERLIDCECKKRLEELYKREMTLNREDAVAQEDFSRLCSNLPVGLQAPATLSHENIRAAQNSAAITQLELESALADARRRQESIDADFKSVVRRWRQTVNVVGGPISCLSYDHWLADPSIVSESFDLLIVDEAHTLTDSELCLAAKRARRWVFVGEPIQGRVAGGDMRIPPTRGQPSRKTHPRVDLFARLWNALHHETWIIEGERLCCRLTAVAPESRIDVESEYVADRPDIELRILNSRSADPVLAEVLFQKGTNLAEAAQFLFNELGEVPCNSHLRTCRWTRDGDFLLFRLNPMPDATIPSLCADLGDGVSLRLTEEVGPDGLSEVALIFSEQDGWNRPKAEAWVAKHLLMPDWGRSCQLKASHRHDKALASWLNEAVAGDCRYPVEPQMSGAIHFEPIPRRTPVRGQRRGGAGLEISLADPRQREFLPADLAARLPGHGFVNLPEAQAIAESLPRLSSDRTITISAPYRSQVELLRHYCKGFDRIVHHSELAHRECDVLVLSLTRSHATRAVTYGDEPATVIELLTRARNHLMIFGDPGTLARRAQWEGAIDHLDETSGERERQWVLALLHCLPSRPQSVRKPEGAKV